MDKYFVCLAVSFKYGGVCISGIELQNNEENHSYSIVYNNGNPKWIRPITRGTEHGEIPGYLSATCKVLDILKITNVEACPNCAQSENHYFSDIEKVGHLNTSVDSLNLMCDSQHSLLFGNKGKAVHPDRFATMGYSLMLIKADNVNFFMENRYGTDHKRLRACFTFNGYAYDLPVTDIALCKKASSGVDEINGKTAYYMTISLTGEHDGWHSKLIANVIPMDL